MLVGSSKVDMIKLSSCMFNEKKLVEYSNSLIPEEFKDVQQVKSNQLYLCCLYLRKVPCKEYKARKAFISGIMGNLKVVGSAKELIEVSIIKDLVNRKRLQKFMEEIKR